MAGCGIQPSNLGATVDISSVAAQRPTIESLEDELLTPEGLGKILHLSKTTVEQDATRRPDRLPPPVVIPGGRRMWLRSTVLAWLRALQTGSQLELPKGVTAPPASGRMKPRGRGRPRLIKTGVHGEGA